MKKIDVNKFLADCKAKGIKLELAWRPRLKTFKGCSGKAEFDPETLTGTSYNWGYRICQPVNGRLVLNTYPYSNTTVKHIYAIRCLLDHLGLGYIEIQDPNGLQGGLSQAVDYHVRQLAANKVKHANSRPGSRPIRWTAANIGYHEKALETLKGLGAHYSAETIPNAVATAQANRRKRLDADRERNAWKRVKLVFDTGENKDKPGIHIACDQAYADKFIPSLDSWYNPAQGLIRRVKEEASSQGHKHVYFHIEAWRTALQKISGGERESIITWDSNDGIPQEASHAGS